MSLDVSTIVEQWKAEHAEHIRTLPPTLQKTFGKAKANANGISVWVGGSRRECSQQRYAIAQLLREEGFDADARDHKNPNELSDYHVLIVMGVSAGAIAEVLDIGAAKIKVPLNLYLPGSFRNGYIPVAASRYPDSLRVAGYFSLKKLRKCQFELPQQILDDLNAYRMQVFQKQKKGRPRRTRNQVFQVNGDWVMNKQSISGNNISGGANVGNVNSTINQTDVANTTVTAYGEIRKQLQAVGSILETLGSPDQPKIRNAVADAVAELQKPEPDKDEVGQALDRALNYATKTAAFAPVMAKLAEPVSRLAEWLGQSWDKLMNYVR